MLEDQDARVAGRRPGSPCLLDPRAVASHFETSAMMISLHGVVTLPDAAAIERVYAPAMADLSTKGQARTDFSALSGRRPSHDLAVITGARVVAIIHDPTGGPG
jgi:hypothetical protein